MSKTPRKWLVLQRQAMPCPLRQWVEEGEEEEGRCQQHQEVEVYPACQVCRAFLELRRRELARCHLPSPVCQVCPAFLVEVLPQRPHLRSRGSRDFRVAVHQRLPGCQGWPAYLGAARQLLSPVSRAFLEKGHQLLRRLFQVYQVYLALCVLYSLRATTITLTYHFTEQN